MFAGLTAYALAGSLARIPAEGLIAEQTATVFAPT